MVAGADACDVHSIARDLQVGVGELAKPPAARVGRALTAEVHSTDDLIESAAM